GRRRATTSHAAATRRSGRQAIRGSSGGCRRGKFRVEIRGQLHVLMKQRRAACQFLRRIVFQDRSDDRALRKCRRLREYTLRECGRCRADSEHLERLPARQSLRKKFRHGRSIVDTSAELCADLSVRGVGIYFVPLADNLPGRSKGNALIPESRVLGFISLIRPNLG